MSLSFFSTGTLNTLNTLYGLTNIIIKATGGNSLIPGLNKGYRPSQWSGNSGITAIDAMSNKMATMVKSNINGLFFDAIFSTSTNNTLTVTSHPVQGGANISDHAYMEPVEITMEIGMSDVMDSMVPGQFGGTETKSVNAYRTLCDLQASRVPLTVVTRLNSYTNMVITGISPNDDVTTLYGLKMSVTLKQIIVANVATETISAREWSSGSGANKGEQQPVEVKNSSAIKVMTGRGTDGSQGKQW